LKKWNIYLEMLASIVYMNFIKTDLKKDLYDTCIQKNKSLKQLKSSFLRDLFYI